MGASDVMARSVVTVTQDATIVDAVTASVAYLSWTGRGGSSGSLPKVTCCAAPRPAPSAAPVRGASGFRRTPDWLALRI